MTLYYYFLVSFTIALYFDAYDVYPPSSVFEEFVKDIQMKSFKNYSVLHKRLLNKNMMYAIRNKKKDTYRDFEYERRSSIIIYHILNHQRKMATIYLMEQSLIKEYMIIMIP